MLFLTDINAEGLAQTVADVRRAGAGQQPGVPDSRADRRAEQFPGRGRGRGDLRIRCRLRAGI